MGPARPSGLDAAIVEELTVAVRVSLPPSDAFDEGDAAEVVELLQQKNLPVAMANAVSEFERRCAAVFGLGACAAVSSGTAAIQLALEALGVGAGDEVIVPAHTFVGSAAPIVHVNATPVFVDVDPEAYCLTARLVQGALTSATRAVIVVHLNGYPVDVEPIKALCKPRGVAVIEDVAQALGASVGGAPVGLLGDIACLSFFAQKVVSSGGEGGAVLTSSPDLLRQVLLLRSHGEGPIEGKPGMIWSHLVGHNFRMTGLQAAIGSRQFDLLQARIKRQREIAAEYGVLLQGMAGIQPPKAPKDGVHTYWKYAIRLSEGINAESISSQLRECGVPSRLRYPYALHHQPAFERYHTGKGLPVSEMLSKQVITLPTHPRMSVQQASLVISALKSFVR